MRASLDTNVIIHLYRAGLQNILFEFFDEGVFIYEMIRSIELSHHGKDLLEKIDEDILEGKIKIYTDKNLKELEVYRMFEINVKRNENLYSTKDLGEIYAISLAQTLGTYSLVTDDIKQGGPYMSLLQFEDEVMPFNFADVLILRYLVGNVDALQTIENFQTINRESALNWSFKSHICRFIKRFYTNPYREEDKQWINEFTKTYSIKVKNKLFVLLQTLDTIS